MTKADPSRPYKALAAFVVPIVATIWANLADQDTWSTLGVEEWLTIIVPPILSALLVYYVPNPQVQVVQKRVVDPGPNLGPPAV